MEKTKMIEEKTKNISFINEESKARWPWTEKISDEIYQHSEDWPKISIVTPSYNQGQYIEETIRSVLMQNYPNLEYVIIDGGSTDESLDIIKKYESHLKYWVSEKDDGQSDAINKGIGFCTGELFNWINSDDYYEPNAFYKIAKAYIKEKSDVIVAKTNNFTLDKNWTSYTPLGDDFFMFSKAKIDQPSTFFKLETFKKYFPLSTSLNLVMDAEIWFKYLLDNEEKNIIQIDDVVVNFREHESSKTVNNRFRIVLDRGCLLSLILKAIKGDENQFSKFINKCDSQRISKIKRGINDFLVFWLKYSIKKINIEASVKFLKYYYNL